MKEKNELKIVNSLLSLKFCGALGRQSFDRITSPLAAAANADRVILYLASPVDGGLDVAAETARPDSPPSTGHWGTGTPLASLAAELSESLLSDQPGKYDPVWDGSRSAVFTPLHPGGQRGLLAILAGGQESLASFSASFFNVLGETVTLVLDDLFTSETTETQLNELRLLHEIGTATYTSLKVAELVPEIAKQTAKELGADSVHVLLLPKPGAEGDTALTSSWPAAPPKEVADALPGIVEQLARNKTVEVDIPCPWLPVPGARYTGLPLFRRQEPLGAAVILHRHQLLMGVNPTSDRDRRAFLESLAAEVSLAVGNAVTQAEADRLAMQHEHRLRTLSVLFEISQALAGIMRLDELLKMILTAATYGHGLGFNRAALFLLNEKTNTLQGMMGVGPENIEEASRIWCELSTRSMSLKEILRRSTKSLRSTALDAAVKTVRVPVTPESGILAKCILERTAFNVTDSEVDPRVNQEVAKHLGTKAFAAAPMIAEDKVLGVLAVDNLFNGRPITPEDVQLLSTFANQAAMAINNAQLYYRMEKTNLELKGMYRRMGQVEQLAALGQMAATVAHEVRNPLVSVGGFTRRLERRLDRNDPNRRYTGIILKELARLENFLSEILIFSRDMPLTITEVDLNRLIADMAEFFRDELAAKQISLDLRLAENLPPIEADREQLSQVMMNFFRNSIDALENGGRITIESHPPSGQHISFSFADTGGGVPESVLDSIFSPFFTTKSRGTGLGLSLVDKMVKSHGGTIEVVNRPGESITFIVRLPLRRDDAGTNPETLHSEEPR